MDPLPTVSPSSPDPVAVAVTSAPWWRYPIVWVALAGPIAVVLASFATMAIAVRHADVVVSETQAQQVARGAALAGTTAPALQARNHAATPAP